MGKDGVFMEKPRQVPVFVYPSSQSQQRTHWRPMADICRIRNGWLLKFDLAGVRMEDVLVEVRGCRVTVSGTRRDWTADEAGAYYSMEISYNRFERTVELPCQVDNPCISLESRDGILIIRLTEA